ncbi:hypothetical protein [Xenorhabdus koppenhoeferi]|uniref:hypothetical protein n=1 Tax=Xenorhabdus koppenhoeferi TaxID=351659 RepID=UPI002B400F83|nr:hypothetical protein [Xenorhabdus sp. Vera]
MKQRIMVRTIRHRQSKEEATDMPDPQNYCATSRLYPFREEPPTASPMISQGIITFTGTEMLIQI